MMNLASCSLSVLIPSYNYDCSTLIRTISQQLEADDEVLVADDGSTDEQTKEQNRKTCQEVGARFLEREGNTGRASTCNFLAQAAKGEWIIIMDCDARCDNPDFLKNYRAYTGQAEALCGGTASPATCPSPNVSLRWRYESSYWSKHNAAIRNQSPFHSLTTFNFMIRRDVFLSIRFRDSITTYGHEDTLLGEDMHRRGIHLLHIDNPLTHMGLDTNEQYLEKVKQSIDNLIRYRHEIGNTYSIIRLGSTIERLHLQGIFHLFFSLLRPALRRNLTGANPNLRLLQVYKLGLYLEELKILEN